MAKEKLTKVDTIVLYWSIVPPHYDGGMLDSRAINGYKSKGDALCNRLFVAAENEVIRPAWIDELVANFGDLYCVDIYAGVKFDKKRRKAVRHLAFKFVKGKFEYEIGLHFDGIPRFYWSGSLFNFHIGGYVDLERQVDNRKAYDELIDYLNRFKQRCNEILCFDKGMVLERYEKRPWMLSRLDLAVDYRLGADALMFNLEELKDLSLPGYSEVVYHEFYKAIYYPVKHVERAGCVKLPTMNVYNKTDELMNVIGVKMGHKIPDDVFEAGWLRVELQFYNGARRKDLSYGIGREVRAKIIEQKFNDDDLLRLYDEYDVIGRRLIRGVMQCVENDVTKKLYSYFRMNHGTFSIRGLQIALGFSDERMKVVRKVVVGLCAQGFVNRRGWDYFVNEEFYESLLAGKFVVDVPEEEEE